MPRFRHIQSDFRGGEISPAVWGRTDLSLYGSSAEEILNFIVKSEGGISRRPGTQFIKKTISGYSFNQKEFKGGTPALGETINLTGKVRLIPFKFSRTEAYCVVFKIDPTWDSVVGIINNDTFADASIEPSPEYETFPTYYWGNIFDGWDSDDELDEIQYAQSGDFLFFCHPKYPPFYIVRTNTDSFAIRPWWWAPTVLPGKNSNAITVTPLNNFGERAVPYSLNLDSTITMSAAANAGPLGQVITSSKSYFTADHLGSYLKITAGGTTHYRRIIQFISSTSVRTVSNVVFPQGSIAATTNWEISEWSEIRGWPRSITFFEQRLFFGGTTKKPDTHWGSEIGDIFEFDALGAATDPGYGTPVSSDPFSFTAAATEINQIQWLSASKVLNTGTLGREYTSQGTQSALSPLDISVSAETAHGSKFRQALRSENAMFFITKTGKKIREFIFNDTENSYQAADVNRLAKHLLNKTLKLSFGQNPLEINHIVKQESDEILLWVLDSNGGLSATTKDREAEMNAFHYHIFGGSYKSKIPEVQSMISLPSADGTSDDLWIAIQRTIDGNDVTYIERINKEFDLDDTANSSIDILRKMIYCDSAILYKPGGSFATVTGLSHLEGETVVAVGDGFYLGEYVVTGGQITLNYTVTEAVVGLNYISRLKTLNLEAGSGIGSSQGAIKKFDQLTIRFHRAIGAKFGFNESELQEIEFRPVDLAMNEPTPLFTGDKIVQFPLNYDRESRLIVEQDLPMPCSVVALIVRGMTND